MGVPVSRRTKALRFHSTSLHIVRRDSEVWLRGPQIADALGYGSARQRIQQVYEKHAAEFTDRMTQLVTLPTAGGPQEVRVFSLRGAHLLAMFARTERAAEFRRWVLDVLDQQATTAGPAPKALALARHQTPMRTALAPTAPTPSWNGGAQRFEMPADVRAIMERHAFALAHAAYAELREWLVQRAHQHFVTGRGEWFDPKHVQEQMNRVGLADWQAAYHAKRVRAARVLAESIKSITAEWAEKLAAQCDSLEPELSADRPPMRNAGGSALMAVAEFLPEQPGPGGKAAAGDEAPNASLSRQGGRDDL